VCLVFAAPHFDRVQFGALRGVGELGALELVGLSVEGKDQDA
jgi:hypothetical protein